MIIRNEREATEAVLGELAKAPDARIREVLSALVRHLHDFAREVNLTEREFQKGLQFVVRLGQQTTDSHNEAVLMAGSLGLSTLVCLLNNGSQSQSETMANLLGPFWRRDSPPRASGSSMVCSPTPGPVLIANITVRDCQGNPVEGAEVDVWHCSSEGLYDIQDPQQADMNLRGKFRTDAEGRFAFRSVVPSGYPIPITGAVGDLLRAQGRHNRRPAHLHFLVFKSGFKTLISQIYRNDDPYLQNDVQFGVTQALVGNFVPHDGPAPFPDVEGTWYSLEHTLVIEPGESRLPIPPIK